MGPKTTSCGSLSSGREIKGRSERARRDCGPLLQRAIGRRPGQAQGKYFFRCLSSLLVRFSGPGSRRGLDMEMIRVDAQVVRDEGGQAAG